MLLGIKGTVCYGLRFCHSTFKSLRWKGGPVVRICCHQSCTLNYWILNFGGFRIDEILYTEQFLGGSQPTATGGSMESTVSHIHNGLEDHSLIISHHLTTCSPRARPQCQALCSVLYIQHFLILTTPVKFYF